MRTTRRPLRRVLEPAPQPARDAGRREAEQRALSELETWRARAIRDGSAPLEADDLVRLLRDCVAALALDAAIAADFTVNTVHYYRRKDIIDPPAGRTAAARYELRHLWQVAGARLAGYLGLVTLAEARSEIRNADTVTLLAFLAARVADARARHVMRNPIASSGVVAHMARPLPGRARSASPASIPAVMISLPGDAWCVVPAAHEAHTSRDAADALARALVAALRHNRTP